VSAAASSEAKPVEVVRRSENGRQERKFEEERRVER
jgi:hypothetical protein